MIVGFAKALWRHWWALMSSAVFTFLGIYIAATQQSNWWATDASLLAGALLVLVACYKAWAEQAKIVDSLNHTVWVALFVQQDGLNVKNVQPETALQVAIGEICNDGVEASFSVADYLEPNHVMSVGYFHPNDSGSAAERRLKLYFSNSNNSMRWCVPYVLYSNGSKRIACQQIGAGERVPWLAPLAGLYAKASHAV